MIGPSDTSKMGREMNEINLSSNVITKWAEIVSSDYVNPNKARNFLLTQYPPFMKEWGQLRLFHYFGNTNELAVRKFAEKWQIDINWSYWKKNKLSRTPCFMQEPSASLIEHSIIQNTRSSLFEIDQKNYLTFLVNKNATSESISKDIDLVIKRKAGRKQKKKSQLTLAKVDIAIWNIYVQGYGYNDKKMTDAYRAYDSSATDALIEDRLRGKKGRIYKLKLFVDPKGTGNGWNPGEDLEFLPER